MTKLNQLLAQDDYCLVSIASVKKALNLDTLKEYENNNNTIITKQYYLDGLDKAYTIGYQNAIDSFKKKSKPNKIEVFTECRKQFEDAVIKIFGQASNFLDFIEYERYSDLYDVFYSADDECYIINRGTGEYINWYKFITIHIGRDIHSTVNPNDFVTFLEEFKGEKE